MKRIFVLLAGFLSVLNSVRSQPGGFETSFGNNGKAAFNFSASGNVNQELGKRIFELPDGKILAVFSAGPFYMTKRTIPTRFKTSSSILSIYYC